MHERTVTGTATGMWVGAWERPPLYFERTDIFEFAGTMGIAVGNCDKIACTSAVCDELYLLRGCTNGCRAGIVP